MAGANNAQMKVAGWKARDITKARAERGKLSHDAMRASGFAPKKGHEPATRAKAGAKAESGAPAGWKAAARGEGKEQRQAATAARGDYLKGQAAAAGKARRADLAGRGLRDVAGAMMARRKAAGASPKATPPRLNVDRHIARRQAVRKALQDRSLAISDKRAKIREAIFNTEREVNRRDREPTYADMTGKNRDAKAAKLRKAQRVWDRPRRRLDKLRALEDRAGKQWSALDKRVQRANAGIARAEKRS